MAKSKLLRIGIIGCGTIGTFIAKICQEQFVDKVEVVGVCDIVKSKATALAKNLKTKVDILEINGLINKSDLVIEAASKDVVATVAENVLSAGKSIMVMSVGGLLGKEYLFKLAEKKRANIFIPSGAICGLDGIKALAMNNIKSIVLTTKKPKKGLEGAPYLMKNNINLAKIDKESVVFEGSAAEAIEGFPKNVNVAAILSLVGIGPEKTRVRIVTSPSIARNIHEITISGNAGDLSIKIENIPFPENPKTSFLAALSAAATLKNILSSTKIGT